MKILETLCFKLDIVRLGNSLWIVEHASLRVSVFLPPLQIRVFATYPLRSYHDFTSPPSRFLKLKVWLVVCIKPNVTMNNPKRNTTVVTSGWNRCFEHVFPPKKKNLVDANHLPRECSSAFGNHWPGWPSIFWHPRIVFVLRQKSIF